MYKMIFTKDGIRTKKDEVNPLTGETLEKASGSHHIYVWIRAAPDLHDYKHLAQPCDDSSLTHGNFKIELSTVEIDDVMPLIEQSLAFRRSDDYFKVYSRLVKNL